MYTYCIARCRVLSVPPRFPNWWFFSSSSSHVTGGYGWDYGLQFCAQFWNFLRYTYWHGVWRWMSLRRNGRFVSLFSFGCERRSWARRNVTRKYVTREETRALIKSTGFVPRARRVKFAYPSDVNETTSWVASPRKQPASDVVNKKLVIYITSIERPDFELSKEQLPSVRISVEFMDQQSSRRLHSSCVDPWATKLSMDRGPWTSSSVAFFETTDVSEPVSLFHQQLRFRAYNFNSFLISRLFYLNFKSCFSFFLWQDWVFGSTSYSGNIFQ